MGRSLADDMRDDVTRTFLSTSDFAQSVTRNPNNDSEEAETVVGMFTESPPQQDKGRGKDNLRRGILLVAITQDVDDRDTWVIDGKTWRVESLGTEPDMNAVHLVRGEPNIRTQPDRKLY